METKLLWYLRPLRFQTDGEEVERNERYKMNEQIRKCIVCGHELSVEDWDNLPDDATCPECGVSKSDYELVTL